MRAVIEAEAPRVSCPEHGVTAGQRATVRHWDAILTAAEHGLSDGLVEA